MNGYYAALVRRQRLDIIPNDENVNPRPFVTTSTTAPVEQFVQMIALLPLAQTVLAIFA